MKMPRWPFWIWPVSGIVVVVAIYGVMSLPRFVTSGPQYCLTCHATGDTPNVGPASLVHPSYDKVGCTQCHARNPNQLILTEGYRGGYSADPKQVSARCQSCHQDILDKPLSEFRFNTMNINIPHRFHVETVGAKCTDCHRNVAHDMSAEQTNRPKMEYCAQCHSIARPAAGGDTSACLKCHTKGPPSADFFVAAPQAELLKPAPQQQGTGAAQQPSGLPRIPHTLDGRDSCLLCHGPGGLKPVPSDHAGRTEQMCRLCHQPASQ